MESQMRTSTGRQSHTVYTHCTLTVHSVYTRGALSIYTRCTRCTLTVHSLYSLAISHSPRSLYPTSIWLVNRLGIMANANVSVMARQSLVGYNYSLLGNWPVEPIR
jgi:hypothetical protein